MQQIELQTDKIVAKRIRVIKKAIKKVARL
jgi:hypothetical protein